MIGQELGKSWYRGPLSNAEESSYEASIVDSNKVAKCTAFHGRGTYLRNLSLQKVATFRSRLPKA